MPVLACFDDALPRPRASRGGSCGASARAAATRGARRARSGSSPARVLALVALLSVAPVRNLLVRQPGDEHVVRPLDLVNTYGAFGSVGRERDEIVLEGTDDAGARRRGRLAGLRVHVQARRPDAPALRRSRPITTASTGRSGSPPCRAPEAYPWSLHLVWKLLHDDPGALGLLASDPFPARRRASSAATLYRYASRRADDPGGAWWTRERIGSWLPPLSADDPRLRRFLESYDWPVDDGPAAGPR